MLCLILYTAIVITILCLLLKTYYFEPQFLDGIHKRPVFITGCDSGFGYLSALKLLKSGCPVFAGCFTEAGMEQLKGDSKGYPGFLQTVQIDVSKEESVRNAVDKITKTINTKGYKGLWGVVNNAAVPGPQGPDDWFTTEDYQHCLDVNTLGAIRVTRMVKPLIKQFQGRIVMVSSIAARLCHPFLSPYTVSKFAIEGYCDCIRVELKNFHVSVHIIEPGPFATNITSISGMQDRMQQAWDKADKQATEEYGEKYLSELKLSLGALGELALSTKIDLPPIDIYHALLSKYPRSRYQCGSMAKYAVVPISLLPAKVQDFFLYTIPSFTATAQPIPQSLS